MSKVYLIIITFFGFQNILFAYLDPGSQSIIIGAIIGLFSTITLFIKSYWFKIKNLFKKTDDIEKD